MAGVVRTPQANADLDGIWDYIAPHNLAAADRLIDRIVECCESLAANPRMGTICGHLAPGLPTELRQFPVGNYVIFYRSIADGIVVYRVLHGHRDIPQVFRREPLDDVEE
jgi:toxin ParE1/3/4